jgi:Flp pilus assembly protein TadD
VLPALALVSGCVAESAPAVRDAYVGRTRCAGCHAEAAAAWTGSHHDLAMQEVGPESVLGDFDGVTLERGGVTTVFRHDGDRFIVRTDGPDGGVADFEVAYTFGVTPLQQLVIRFPNGRFQMLDIAWDARPPEEGGQRWFSLQPDVDAGSEGPFHWTRPSQRWNTHCAECHATDLRKGFDVASRAFETTWAEIDVSCEACHGPGAAHVALAEAAAGGVADAVGDGWGLRVDLVERGRIWVLSPDATTATLAGPQPWRTEIEACAACHARRARLGARRPSASGLHDAYAISLLRADLYHADGQIMEEVYVYGSFAQSRMYAAGVICSDCHEPHSLELRAEGNALCTTCHRASTYDAPSHHFHEPSGSGARCVECHMPATTYMVVDPRRDHSIRIPSPELSRAIGVPNACNRCHTDRTTEWAVAAAERWYGPRPGPDHYGLALHAGRRGDPAAAPVLLALGADSTRPAIVRGTALSLLADFPSGGSARALEVALSDPEPLVRLGAVQGLRAQPALAAAPLALRALDDAVAAVRFEAVRLLAPLPPPTDPDEAAIVERAIAEYERVQLDAADDSGSWVTLGDLYASRRRVAEAEAAYETALELDPTDLGASLNLADLLRALGREEEGERVLLAAERHHPTSAALLHAIGLLRVRRGAAGEAIAWLERAAAADPDNPRWAYVHAVAVASSGDVAHAVDILEEALALHPFDRDVLSGLATYARDLGRLDEARGYARRWLERAPDDPDARALVQQLGGGR